MHHFHIYVEVLGMRIQGIGQKTWANYLFLNLDYLLTNIAIHEVLFFLENEFPFDFID